MGRRTFRLLKEDIELEKGALVQEKCDDGNQEFIILSGKKKICGDDRTWYSRATVLKQPEFFVEVFPVIPEYATKEEIKQFKAKKAK